MDTKEIISNNEYLFKVSYNTQTKDVVFYIPKRTQEPVTDGYNITYSISDNGFLYTLNGETEEIRCPEYARVTVIFSDIRMICDYLKFNTELLEFFVDDARIEPVEFVKTVRGSYEISRKETEFALLITRAMTALIPFHESFYFESRYLDVEFGYKLVKFLFDNRGK